jgi:hypothetical protein
VPVGLALVLVPVALTGVLETPAAGLAAAVLGLALVPLIAAGRFVAAVAVTLGWWAGHALMVAWLVPAAFSVPLALLIPVALALAAMFALQAAIVLAPCAPCTPGPTAASTSTRRSAAGCWRAGRCRRLSPIPNFPEPADERTAAGHRGPRAGRCRRPGL